MLKITRLDTAIEQRLIFEGRLTEPWIAWIAPPAVSAALRYGLAFASVAVALGLARIFLYFHLPQPFAAFALSAIAITFWYGGTKPGVVAAVLASIILLAE